MKNFTIEAEVRLYPRWHVPVTPEEEEALDDRLGVIACELDDVVGVLVEEQIEKDSDEQNPGQMTGLFDRVNTTYINLPHYSLN
jgi:hypothetical protein